jgi:hypothetical protein
MTPLVDRAQRRGVDLSQGAQWLPVGILLTQINGRIAASPNIQSVNATRGGAMFNSSQLDDELQALKIERSQLLNHAGDAAFAPAVTTAGQD